MKKPKVIQRGNIVYYLYDEKAVVKVGSQYVSYNVYDNWNRQGINQFIKIIKNSKEDEYSTATDQMSLAVRCGIRGASTSKPKETDDEV